MQLPQTRQLLQTFAPEWFEMSWGLGTLAAADTAYQLWRPGLRAAQDDQRRVQGALSTPAPTCA